jgi:hypothetical protein
LGSTWVSKKKNNTLLKIIGGLFTFGATLFSGPLSETSYKKIIQFDGATDDWGKMSYVNDIMKTEQSK